MGGRYGNPGTCKGIFRHMACRLDLLDADGSPMKEHPSTPSPGILVDGRGLQEKSTFVAGTQTVCEVKALPAGGAYTENRSDKPNAAVNARQK